MKIFVVGPLHRYERIRSLTDAIAAQGHEITHDWTRNCQFDSGGDLLANTPPEQLAECADAAVRGAAEADLVVCIADERLVGALVEVGAALGAGAEVWLIAPWRESIFWRLPAVTEFADTDAVLAALAPFALDVPVKAPRKLSMPSPLQLAVVQLTVAILAVVVLIGAYTISKINDTNRLQTESIHRLGGR